MGSVGFDLAGLLRHTMHPMDCCADDGEGGHGDGRPGPEVRACRGAFDARVLQAQRLLPPRKPRFLA
eukprot:14670186-Heterocapsa_arctica.AAC.1